MAKIFCVANQKGGVGKTTTTVNLAAGLAKVGQRVLMIDLDPQGNATMGSGIDKRQLELTVYDVLLESASVAEARVKADKLVEGGCGYDVLGANRELAGAEVEMVALDRREKRLRTALAAVGAEYDFVLIDCPPSLGVVVTQALLASDHVLIPVAAEYYAFEGTQDLEETIKSVRRSNPALNILGYVVTRFDSRTSASADALTQAQAMFGDKLFETLIRSNTHLIAAPAYRKSIFEYAQASRGSEDYLNLTSEFLSRLEMSSRIRMVPAIARPGCGSSAVGGLVVPHAVGFETNA